MNGQTMYLIGIRFKMFGGDLNIVVGKMAE
jgi:hypothetical protein